MYIYSKKMFKRRAQPIWIIGDPDKWSCTVLFHALYTAIYSLLLLSDNPPGPTEAVYMASTRFQHLQ